jgi:hypothetical protein
LKYFIRLAAIGFAYSLDSVELKHCTAAIRGATVAREFLFGCLRDRFVDFQPVIIKQFLASLDVANGMDEDAIIFFDSFAVRIARVIDPPRVVTANFWIDYIAVFQPKDESVWTVLVVGGGFPGDAFSRVFDNASAFGNELHRVNAPAVHTGLANLDLYGSL